MADYTYAELLNEVSKVFRAGLNPGKTGGTLNTATEYQQLLEMASITFLAKPDSVFYIARLAANQLNNTIVQEVAILEDLLVALDDLSQIGSPVRDTTTLSNARTSVLSLDAAESISGRPETQKFMRQMDTFATQLRKNLVSQDRDGTFVRPREEARNLIQSNLLKLDEIHAELLDRIFALRDTLEEFLAQDLPSKVSTSTLASVNSRLQAAIDDISSNSNTDNVAASRRLFLETLANKISVKILSTFTDPSELKYRSPTRPIPSTLKHSGQVTGQGEPASVLTRAGPWDLPISAPLVLSVNGETPISLDLDNIKGAVLPARTYQSYTVPSTKRNLHVVVDPNIYSGTAIAGASTTAINFSPYLRLGFKHLGSVVSFPNANVAVDPNDIHTRFITDMRSLQTALAINISFVDPILTVTSTIADQEAAIGFQPGHVGAYIKDSSGNRFEILSVLSVTQCVLDARGLTPNFATGLAIRGQYSSFIGNSRIVFSPALTTASIVGDKVNIGPTVKTAQLTAGSRSAANIISDIQSEAGVFDSGDDGAKLNWHISPELASGDSTRICLRIRSKLDPFVQISSLFIRPHSPVALATIESESGHVIFGYREGEMDTTNLLTAAEVADLINDQTGLAAEVITTEVKDGTLTTVAQTSQVTASGIDTGLTGYEQIEVLDGSGAGTYRVISTSTDILNLQSVTFQAQEGSRYRIFREQVKIYVVDAGPGTSLEVVSAPTEFELSVGTVYSSISSFEAVDKLGNKLAFSNVVPGDLLKVVGQPEVAIASLENDDTTLVLESGLPSTTSGMGFEVRSAAAKAFSELNEGLTTYTESPNLLKKNKFDEDVSAIDNACTSAIMVGQNFTSSRNQAKRMVADLLSILTSTLLRQDEYTVSVTPDVNNLSDLLVTYEASTIEEVNNILEAFLDRKYDRAATLLREGKFTDFYATTEETGSYSGAVMSASRSVIRDLPRVSSSRSDFLNQRDVATSMNTVSDADTDFSDTENQPEDLGL